METLPPEQLREVQLLKLRRMVQWAWQNSPFYREKFDRAGVKARDIQSLDDLRRFPLTEKSEWLAAQGSELPTFGKTAAVPEADVIRYHQTSGTSGNPIRLAFSLRDWNVWLECWGYGLSAAQLTARDRVLVCFPFNLFVGWWGRPGCCPPPGLPGVFRRGYEFAGTSEGGPGSSHHRPHGSSQLSAPAGPDRRERVGTKTRRDGRQKVDFAAPRQEGPFQPCANAWRRPGKRRCSTTWEPVKWDPGDTSVPTIRAESTYAKPSSFWSS